MDQVPVVQQFFESGESMIPDWDIVSTMLVWNKNLLHGGYTAVISRFLPFSFS